MPSPTVQVVSESGVDAATIVLAVLTGLLVLITAYYAWETHRMAEEMRRARGSQLLPKLALTMAHLGAGNFFLRISNAGIGPASGIDVELQLVPNGPTRRITEQLLLPGEFHDFTPDPSPGAPNGRLHVDQFLAAFTGATLRGKCQDALGDQHAVEETLDIASFWAFVVAAERIQQPDRLREAVRHLETLAKTVSTIARNLQRG